jgi:ribosomal protein S18 acetylase RimI-like enzyme
MPAPLEAAEQRAFVATRGDDVAGVLTLEEVRLPAALGRRADQHAFIHFLAVAPAHRRQGVATQLLQHARSWSAEHGFHTVRLHVWEHNEAARRLYERAGYATLSRTLETKA